MSTGFRAGALGAFILLSLGTPGCVDPVVVNTAPPGLDPKSILELPKEAEEPQAVGETGNTSSAPIPNRTVIVTIPPAPPTAKGETKTTASGTKYETIKEGSGTPAKGGRITVHYVGMLDDGRKFDSSRDKGSPATFTIGTGQVIKGWDEAVPGMLPGEIRKLQVPASAGYGALGKPPVIPPNAELVFEIELIKAEG